MKQGTLFLLTFIAILAFSSCEKDDICEGGDTPLLVIEFFDILDSTELKDVAGLTVRGFIFPDSTLATIANTSASSVSLPLRTNQDSTSFILTRQLSANDSLIADTLTFTYTREENFFSRACGFLVTYTELAATLPPEDSLWVREIRIDTTRVDNLVQSNVQILH